MSAVLPYPNSLSGPKSITIVFCSDLRPMVQMAIAENGHLVENNFFGSPLNRITTGGIEYVASQLMISARYRSHDVAVRTLYRILNEQAICGAHIADALAIACETSLYTESIEEYPSRYKAAMEMVLIEAEAEGEELTPFDIQERATDLWHKTYDRYLIEVRPFRERYEQARTLRRNRHTSVAV